jgi:signal transduction histidine kinase
MASAALLACVIGLLPHPVDVAGTAVALLMLTAFHASRRRRWLGAASSAQADAAERRHRLDAVFNATGDGLLLYDASRQVVAANPRCSELLGFTNEQLTQCAPAALMLDLSHRCAEPDTYRERLEAHFADPTAACADELVLIEPRRRVLKRLSCPATVDGGVGRVFTYTDITAESDVDRMKSEFVATASHELRTPLTSIHAALQLVVSGSAGRLEPEDREMLEITVRSADRLVRIVNDLLDLSKLEAGRMTFEPSPLIVDDLCHEVTAGLLAVAAAREIRIVVDVPADAHVSADHDQLVRVLTNLVGNAIKYSPAGSTVTLGGRAVGHEMELAVADQGPGIPAEHVSRLFTPFSRLGVQERQASGGTGLGLAISRAIVLQHGGQIWWERNQPAGSRFVFRIPSASDAAPEAA